jgi:AcrR family transcriptional regulator
VIEGAAPVGRRERKKQETRTALHRSALQLFAEKGYRETRVSDIAEAADVSEATFFRYFSCKEEVALVALMTRIDSVLTALAARPVEERPLAACLAIMGSPGAIGLAPGPDDEVTITLLAGNPALTGYFFWQITQVTARLAAEFARRLGTEATALEPQLLASTVVAALDAVLHVWLADPRQSPFELTGRAFRSLAVGLEPAD